MTKSVSGWKCHPEEGPQRDSPYSPHVERLNLKCGTNWCDPNWISFYESYYQNNTIYNGIIYDISSILPYTYIPLKGQTYVNNMILEVHVVLLVILWSSILNSLTNKYITLYNKTARYIFNTIVYLYAFNIRLLLTCSNISTNSLL